MSSIVPYRELCLQRRSEGYDIDPIKKTGQSGNSDTSTVRPIVRGQSGNVKAKYSLKEYGTCADVGHGVGQPTDPHFDLH